VLGDATGKALTFTASQRDTQWNTWTCVLGWPVIGIWAKSADGTDVNAVDRSRDSQLLVTADDSGHVRLFRYPCFSRSVCSMLSEGIAVIDAMFTGCVTRLFRSQFTRYECPIHTQ